MEVEMLTVYFEDHGQDFLEWDIEDGVVVACRPFQGWVWEGTRVIPMRCVTDFTGQESEDIQPGDILQLLTKKGKLLTLNYPVERVEVAVA